MARRDGWKGCSRPGLQATLLGAPCQEHAPEKLRPTACTIYSALGIDWTKTIKTTPSGR